MDAMEMVRTVITVVVIAYVIYYIGVACIHIYDQIKEQLDKLKKRGKEVQ